MNRSEYAIKFSLLAYVLCELESLGFGTDNPIDGADCVEAMGVLYDQLARERAELIDNGIDL